MPETYSSVTWTNDTGQKLNAANMNRIDAGVKTIDVRAAKLELGVDTPVTVGYASSITPNATQGALFRITATGNFTLNEPTGGTDGQTIALEVVASGAAVSMSFAGGALTPVSIPNGELCVVSLRYRSADTAWVVLDIQGFTGGTPTGGGGGGGGGGGTTPARFKGDPGPGKVLTGGTVYTGSMGVADGNAWLDDETGVNHLFKRIYYTNLWSRTTIQNYRNAGKMPSIAWKANADASNIAAIAGGSIDAAITAEAVWAASVGYPIYTAFFHEPEDNFTTSAQAANYRAAYRRIVNIFKTNGATNVVWIGVAYMTPWTFEGSGRTWWWWDPDWKGTLSGAGGAIPNASDWYTGDQAVCQIMSFDTYTPEIGSSSYHEFFDSMDPALDDMTAAGRPIIPWIVPEMGTKVATPMPGDGWTGFFQRAFRYMRDNNGVGFVYYNTDDNNFLNGSDAVARFAGYQAALASEASYLVSTRPPDEGVASTTSVTLVGASNVGGNAATITPALPATRQVGDVGYLFWTHSPTSVVGTDPTAAGWTQLASNNIATSSGFAKVYRKVLTSTESNPTMTMSDGITRQSAVMVVYRGVNTTTPEDVTITVDTTHTTGTSHNAPAITTSNPSVLLTAIHERGNTIDTDWTAGGGYTERADTTTAAVGNGGTITAVADNGLTTVPAGTHTPSNWFGDHLTGTANIVTYTLALRVA